MNKLDKLADKQYFFGALFVTANRLDTIMERNFTEQGTENYNTLSEVAKMILSEIPAVAKSRSNGKVNRYGFRLYGRNYKLVTLANSQRI